MARGRCTSAPPNKAACCLKDSSTWTLDRRSLDRCFQLMEADDPALFDEWTAAWSDLAEFEIVEVIGSPEAAKRALRR